MAKHYQLTSCCNIIWTMDSIINSGLNNLSKSNIFGGTYNTIQYKLLYKLMRRLKQKRSRSSQLKPVSWQSIHQHGQGSWPQMASPISFGREGLLVNCLLPQSSPLLMLKTLAPRSSVLRSVLRRLRSETRVV